jgi:CheY-like chemotaxis protein
MTLAPGRPRQILVVEDDGLIAMHLQEMLESRGFKVPGIFASGEEVIAYLGHTPPPDLILMDIRLDGKIDGLEAARWIRERFTLPIIFLSGNVDKELIPPSGTMRNSLTKPFSRYDLFEAIDGAFK